MRQSRNRKAAGEVRGIGNAGVSPAEADPVPDKDERLLS